MLHDYAIFKKAEFVMIARLEGNILVKDISTGDPYFVIKCSTQITTINIATQNFKTHYLAVAYINTDNNTITYRILEDIYELAFDDSSLIKSAILDHIGLIQ